MLPGSIMYSFPPPSSVASLRVTMTVPPFTSFFLLPTCAVPLGRKTWNMLRKNRLCPVATTHPFGRSVGSKTSRQNCLRRMIPFDFTSLFPPWCLESIRPANVPSGRPGMPSSHHVGCAVPRGGSIESASGFWDISCRLGRRSIRSPPPGPAAPPLTAVAANRSARPMAAVDMARRRFDDTTELEGFSCSPRARRSVTAASSLLAAPAPPLAPPVPIRFVSLWRCLRSPSACRTPLALRAES
mmetsp:Transcript_35433/g.84611  ORF Transcript_35433/g.84611 Transcript_35433/m.84611 type:complete len:242 (+) Transcript_35433:174-899(+)